MRPFRLQIFDRYASQDESFSSSSLSLASFRGKKIQDLLCKEPCYSFCYFKKQLSVHKNLKLLNIKQLIIYILLI